MFLSAIAAKTERIKVGFGIRQVISNYNHPARTAEAVGMLDLISHGRAQFGIGEGATRLELGGFGIQAKRKRAMSLEAAREVADMMVMEPYPGYECEERRYRLEETLDVDAGVWGDVAPCADLAATGAPLGCSFVPATEDGYYRVMPELERR